MCELLEGSGVKGQWKRYLGSENKLGTVSGKNELRVGLVGKV